MNTSSSILNHDPTKVAFWAQIAPEMTILWDAGKSMYRISTVIRLYEVDQLAEWHFFELNPMMANDPLITKGEPRTIWIVVKIVDQIVELRLFWLLLEGTRQEIVSNIPVFFEDRDPETLPTLGHLAYAPAIQSDEKDAKGVETHTLYAMKGRTYHGSCTLQPMPSGVGDLMASIAEYGAVVTTPSPDIAPDITTFEVAVMDSTEGGHIRIFKGGPAELDGVDVVAGVF